MWAPQSEALFNVRISDTDAQSYLTDAPDVVLSKAKANKKSKYCSATTAHCAHFTPLCFSVDGLAGSEATCSFKRLAYGLSHHWESNYPKVMFWIRANLAFALVRAMDLCIRGTRTKWHHPGFEDGAIIDEWTGRVSYVRICILSAINYLFVVVFVFCVCSFFPCFFINMNHGSGS